MVEVKHHNNHQRTAGSFGPSERAFPGVNSKQAILRAVELMSPRGISVLCPLISPPQKPLPLRQM